MKQRKLFIYIPILLFAIFWATTVRGNEKTEINGDGNLTGNDNVIGDNNQVYKQECHEGATCNFNYPEAASSVNQPNSSTEETQSTYSTNSGGYTPIQNPSPQISNSGGYTPIQTTEAQISDSGGYTPIQNPSPSMSTY